MNDFVERMKAAKAKADAADYQAGYDQGKSWVDQETDVAALQRLDRLYDKLDAEPRYGWDFFFEEHEGTAYGPDESLFFAMYPEDDGDRQAAVGFWEDATGNRFKRAANRSAFLKGFAQAALDSWWSVQDKV